MGQVLQIFRRGDDGHPLMPALRGHSDIGELHPVGFRRELLPVGFQLGVVDQAIIGADVESELFFGAGNVARSLR